MKQFSLLMLLTLFSTSDASLFKSNNHNNQHFIDSFSSQSIWTANINNDGIDDLVITSSNDQGLIIYLGKGGGKFEQLFTTPAIGSVKVSTVFDADGDGDDDVWLQYDTLDDVREVVLFNDGTGLFEQKSVSVSGGENIPFTYQALHGDVDNDGDVDLIKIIGGQGQSGLGLTNKVATLFINDGTGLFEPKGGTFLVERHRQLIDFNNDGYLDMVSAESNLTVFYNDQSGVFSETPDVFELGFSPFSCEGNPEEDIMLFEDIDNDGDIDLQLLSKARGLLRRINNGDGSFVAKEDSFCIPINDVSNGILRPLDVRPIPDAIFVDVNNDGLKDLWVGYDSDTKVLVSLTGANGFMSNETMELEGNGVMSLTEGDFNQDGKKDVVSLNSSGLTSWLHNNERGYTKVDLEKINLGWGFVRSPFAEDFNYDGMVDLIYQQNNHIFYRTGNGAGAFGAPIKIVESVGHDLQMQDLDGNGLKDLLVLEWTGELTALTAHLQNEQGIFTTKEIHLSEENFIPKNNLKINDFDGDGDNDFMVILGGFVHIFENQGGLNFELTQLIGNNRYSAVDFIDLNNMDRPTFIAYSYADLSDQPFSWYQEWTWNGQSFELSRQARTDRNYEGKIVTVDYDGDGDLDILSTSRVDNNHHLLIVNDSDGFTTSQYPYPGNSIEFVEDLNDDGLVDYIDSSSAVYLKQENGEFIATSGPIENSNIEDLVDLDGDGDLDVLATDTGLVTYINQTKNIEMSGLWFNPSEDGHGLSLEHLMINGQPQVLFSWFAVHENQPFWLTGLAPIIDNMAEIDVSFTSGTGFGLAFNSQDIQKTFWGVVKIELQGVNLLDVSWQPISDGFEPGQMTMQRLSVVKEVSTQPHTINSCHSGSWYNPEQDGHGFFIQVIKQNSQDTLVVSWYHHFEGKQFWMVGQGPINGQEAVVSLISGSGGLFPPNFNTEDYLASVWGDLSFKLSSDTTATVSWVSELTGFENGELILEKLTQLDRYQCSK